MQSSHGAVLVCVVLVLAFVVLVACPQSKQDDLSVQQWSDLISKHLPLGSNRENVEKFLDQYHVEHRYIGESKFPDEVNSIVAFARSKDDKGLVKKSGIQLKFKLDGNQRLVSFNAREMFTGP